MASSKLKRAYPNFATYLDSVQAPDSLKRREFAMGSGCLATVGAGLVAAVALGYFLGTGVNAAAGIIGALAGGGLAAAIAGWWMQKRVLAAGQPQSDRERLDQDSHAAAMQFRLLDNQKRLLKSLDPVAAQLLEAGAYHWYRVRETLNGNHWRSPNLPAHWTSLRDRALDASHVAMAELSVMCVTCTGEPRREKKDDLQSVFEDFADLDIQDALRGLAKIAATNDEPYRFTTGRAKELFEPAKEIAERLKSLADQVEKADLKATQEVSLPKGAYATDAIDVLLGEFRAVQQAETELHEEQQT